MASKSKRWVAKVKTDSTHPPPELFTKDASTIARVLASKKSLAQGRRVRHADADILHKPRRSRIEPVAQEGTRTGKIVVVEAKPARSIISKAEGWNEEEVLTPQIIDEGARVGNRFSWPRAQSNSRQNRS